MAVSTRVVAKPRFAKEVQISDVEVPRELVEVLAYQKFEERGREHGHDWGDWFAAERELAELFQAVRWTMTQGKDSVWFTLQTGGSFHAIQTLCRYFQRSSPVTSTVVEGRTAHFRVLWPDEVDDKTASEPSLLNPPDRKYELMKPKEITTPVPDELRQAARHARSPVSTLSPEDFSRLQGKLIALLLDGPDKGKVIATAPLDRENPDKPRRSIKSQIASSPYKNRRYQLRQVLLRAKD